jgi:circadian clock protein KaiC
MSEDDSADDDWFENAFADDSGSDTNEESEPATASGDASADESGANGDTPAADTRESERGDTGTAGFDAGDSGAGPFDAGDDGSAGAGEGTSPFDGGESPFGETGVENDDPFGRDSGASGDGPGGGDDDGLFDDSFGDAMGSAGEGSTDFEADDVESDIPRLDVGIEGLDNMIQGGVPERHLVVVVGGAGTGKTTFGLQFLRHGLTLDDPEKAVFITLEQTYEDIMATADERGWEFRRHEREGNLAVVDLDPVEMANSLDNIRGELPELIEEFGADRFVLDSVSLLEMMYDQQAKRRTEIFDFTQSLKQAGVTTVFTSEASEDNPYASRHGIIEYLTDAVFLLRYVRSETQETRLAVEIQKIRNANHSRETKPYDITLDGISVYEQANIF